VRRTQQGSRTVLGEQFQKHGMGRLAIYDDNSLDTILHHLDTTFDLRDHTVGNGAVRDQRACLLDAQLLDELLLPIEHAFDIEVAPGVTMGDLRRDFEVQHCRYNFEASDPDLQRLLFEKYEAEARRLIEDGMLYPGYDFVLKASHAFNLLDARGVLSQTERQGYVQRVRRLAEAAARAYLEEQGREEGEAA